MKISDNDFQRIRNIGESRGKLAVIKSVLNAIRDEHSFLHNEIQSAIEAVTHLEERYAQLEKEEWIKEVQ